MQVEISIVVPETGKIEVKSNLDQIQLLGWLTVARRVVEDSTIGSKPGIIDIPELGGLAMGKGN